MDLVSFGKNTLLALALLLIVGSIGYADLPLTDRLEEYIAFVLTTDFDYEAWIQRAGRADLLAGLSEWRNWIPWWGGDVAPAGAEPAGPAAGQR